MRRLLLLAGFVLVAWVLKAQTPTPLLDEKFGTDGYVITDRPTGNDRMRHVMELSDGKIMGITELRDLGESAAIGLLRYTADGKPDTSFGENGLLKMRPFASNNFGYDLLELPDKKIIVIGYLFNTSTAITSVLLLKLNEDGSFDESFGEKGKVLINEKEVNLITLAGALQSDGKIIAVGARNSQFMTMRFTSEGKLDKEFGENGIVISPFPNISNARDVKIQKDGKIVVTGFNTNSPTYQIATARLMPDGKHDTSFANQGMISFNIGEGNDFSEGVALQEDGKIVIGAHTWIENQPRLQYDMAVVRFNEDGTFDKTFGKDKNGVVKAKVVRDQGNYTHAIGIAKDGMIFAAGFMQGLEGEKSQGTLVSLNPKDGSFSSTYVPGGMATLSIGGLGCHIQRMRVQKNGTVLVCGAVFPKPGKYKGFIARLSYATTAVEEVLPDVSSRIHIYPNPVKDVLEVSYEGEEQFSARIIDMSGKTLYSQESIANMRLNVSHLPVGNYILQLRSDKSVANKPFVKE